MWTMDRARILDQARLWGDTDAVDEVQRVAARQGVHFAAWKIPAAGALMWDVVMHKVISGRISFLRATKRRRMIVYAMDICGKEVVMHCVDIDGEFCRADVKIDAALLEKLMTAAKVALDA
jgi:hypothetical protein